MARLLRTEARLPLPTATSRPFVEGPNLLLLARVAETWSCRPSDLIEARGTTGLQIDLAAAMVLWRERERLARARDQAV